MATISTTTNFADTLKLLDEHRRAKGITYDQMAERGGYTDRGHAKRQLDPASNPTLKSVLRAADALGVTLNVAVPTPKGGHRLCFLNHAGGVGKTSCIRDVGVQLALYGFKVLLIDLDPQMNLSEWMGISWKTTTLHDTIFYSVVPSALMSNEVQPLPQPRRVFGLLDIIPSTTELVNLEGGLIQQMGTGLTRLRKALDQYEQEHSYDFILIDPPPYISQITMMAAHTAKDIIIPVTTEEKGVSGIRRMIDFVNGIQENHPELSLRMFVPTQHHRTNDDVTWYEALQTLEDIAPLSPPITYRRAPHARAKTGRTPLPLSTDRADEDAKKEIEAVTESILNLFGVNVNVR